MDALLSVIDPATATNVDLRDIATVKKLGGTIDDTELVNFGASSGRRKLEPVPFESQPALTVIGLGEWQLSPSSFEYSMCCVVAVWHK